MKGSTAADATNNQLGDTPNWDERKRSISTYQPL